MVEDAMGAVGIVPFAEGFVRWLSDSGALGYHRATEWSDFCPGLRLVGV